jgi:signal transduction histidine kinase
MRAKAYLLLPVLLASVAAGLSPAGLSAQQRGETERLETMIRSRETRGEKDSVLVRLKLDLAQEYRRGNPDRALQIAREAEAIAREINDHYGLANAYASSGISYAQSGAWVRALNYFLKALQLKDELGDQQGMAALLSNIGVLHGKLNDEERALRYHERALKHFRETNDTRGLAYTYNNIGVIHMERGEYDKALQSLIASLELKRGLRDVAGLASTHLNIGITYFLQGVHTRAMENYERSVELYTNIGDRHGQAEAWQRMGMLYLSRKNAEKTLEYGRKALATATAINARAIERNALKLCSDAATLMGRPTEALEYFRRHTDLKDSLFNEESSKLINEMTANYELSQRERSERENELLKREQRIREMELERRAAQLKDQELSIDLLNKESTISGLKLKEQEAVLLKQQLETTKRNEEIAILQKDKELLAREREVKEIELNRQQTLRNSLIGGSVFLVIILLLLANGYRLKRKTASALEKQNALIETAYSEIKKNEALLQKQAEEIERSNQELTRQNVILEKLNADKNELLGIVAHDLRNPIGGIRMVAEAMVEEGRSPDYLQNKAQLIYDTADMLIVLVRNLLDINRLEAGRMDLDSVPVQLPQVLYKVVGSHQKWAERKGIGTHIDVQPELPPALGDEGAVLQIVDNLVSNAIKYSPHGRDVWLRCAAENGRLRIEVQDEGPGLTQEDLEHLYQKFGRLSAKPTGGESSSGLGLSIVKKLVESMNGSVRCESEAGKGALFIVELPSSPPDDVPATTV